MAQLVLDVPVQIPHLFFLLLPGQGGDEGVEVLVSIVLREIRESGKSPEQK